MDRDHEETFVSVSCVDSLIDLSKLASEEDHEAGDILPLCDIAQILALEHTDKV